MCRRNPDLGMVELWHRLRKRCYTLRPESLFRVKRVHPPKLLAAYPEQSIYSSADFLKKLSKWYTHRVIQVECFQTDNGFEFTNCFFNSRRYLPTLFETTADQLGIWHKLIRPIPRTTT